VTAFESYMSEGSGTCVQVRFDTKVYRLSAVKKAAYRLGDRCHAHFESADEQSVLVILKPKRAGCSLEQLAAEFEAEVLDQDLRESVAEETSGIRNLLLAQAFSHTSLLDPQGENGDAVNDPLDIRTSDRQKAMLRSDISEGD
jgi:His-Xaa-Ser system protein HxsD